MTELKILGSSKTEYPTAYAPEILERFKNKYPCKSTDEYVVELDCPEFTGLCPITSQPDFGTIKIKYLPDQHLVESKSLKLYLYSFRNHGCFHEEVVNLIARDLFSLLKPHWIEVQGFFNPRGGITINPRVKLNKSSSD